MKENSDKLIKASADMHAAKVIVGVPGAIGIAAATFLGYIGKAAIDLAPLQNVFRIH